MKGIRQKKKQEEAFRKVYDAYGFSIAPPRKEADKNRLLLCICKGILVFCLAFGAEWFFLDSFGIESHLLVTGCLLFVFSILMGLLYYNKWAKNLGYLGVLGFFIMIAFCFGRQANSGFAAILNSIYERVDQKFHLPVLNNFYESMADRVTSVTVCMVVIGFVCVVLLNVAVSGRMNFVGSVLLLLPFLAFSLYLDGQPSIGSVFLISAGFFLVYMFRMEGHFISNEKWDGYLGLEKYGIFFRRKKKPGREKKTFRKQDRQDGQNPHGKERILRDELYVYTSDGKTFAGTLLQFLALFLAVVLLFTWRVPREKVEFPKEWSALRQESDEVVRNFFAFGIAGFMGLYQGAGGLSNGKLGNVGSVHPDNATDFLLTMVPYDYDRVYLKGFHGRDYNFEETCWEESQNEKGGYDYEISTYKDTRGEDVELSVMDRENLGNKSMRWIKQEQNRKDAGAGTKLPKVYEMRMKLKDVALFSGTSLYPYGSWHLYDPYGAEKQLYWNEEKVHVLDFMDMEGSEFTPYISNYLEEQLKNGMLSEKRQRELKEQELKLDAMERYARENYLSVPEELDEVLEETAREAGLSGSEEEIVNQLIAYFADNYLYTLRPGYFSWGEDYVTHFLTSSRKGFCAHFATAGTLLLRKMGIPARYCEGYAVDYEEFLDGNEAQDSEVLEKFDGETQWGEKIAVQVNVPDADAHAWVEVYTRDFGWVPVEVTSAPREEERRGGFLENFFGMFGNDGETQGEASAGTAETAKEGAGINYDEVVLCILGAALLGWTGYKGMQAYRRNQGSQKERVKKKYDYIQERLSHHDLSQKNGETFAMYQERFLLKGYVPEGRGLLWRFRGRKRMRLMKMLKEELLPMRPVMEKILYGPEGEEYREFEKVLDKMIRRS